MIIKQPQTPNYRGVYYELHHKVRKQKMGRTNFYINEPLYALLSGVTLKTP